MFFKKNYKAKFLTGLIFIKKINKIFLKKIITKKSKGKKTMQENTIAIYSVS